MTCPHVLMDLDGVLIFPGLRHRLMRCLAPDAFERSSAWEDANLRVSGGRARFGRMWDRNWAVHSTFAAFRPRSHLVWLLEGMEHQGLTFVFASNQTEFRKGIIVRRFQRIGIPISPANAVFSCDVGAVKPEREFFERLRAVVKCHSGCLYLDDRVENVEAARACGFAGIRVSRDSSVSDLVGHVFSWQEGLT
jgi:FMN phosphatase YigB (HAD superfamily)